MVRMTGPQAVIPVALIDERLAEIDGRLGALEREAGPLIVERNALKALKARAVVSQPAPIQQTDTSAPPDYVRPSVRRETPTLTEQLLAFITEKPGLPSTVIADTLVANGFNGGQNPRKNVLTTIGNMI